MASLVDAPHGKQANEVADSRSVPPAELLAELGTKTDLAGLVERVCRSNLPWVVVSESAITAWNARDPVGWAKVSSWLSLRGVTIVRT